MLDPPSLPTQAPSQRQQDQQPNSQQRPSDITPPQPPPSTPSPPNPQSTPQSPKHYRHTTSSLCNLDEAWLLDFINSNRNIFQSSTPNGRGATVTTTCKRDNDTQCTATGAICEHQLAQLLQHLDIDINNLPSSVNIDIDFDVNFHTSLQTIQQALSSSSPVTALDVSQLHSTLLNQQQGQSNQQNIPVTDAQAASLLQQCLLSSCSCSSTGEPPVVDVVPPAATDDADAASSSRLPDAARTRPVLSRSPQRDTPSVPAAGDACPSSDSTAQLLQMHQEQDMRVLAEAGTEPTVSATAPVTSRATLCALHCPNVCVNAPEHPPPLPVASDPRVASTAASASTSAAGAAVQEVDDSPGANPNDSRTVSKKKKKKKKKSYPPKRPRSSSVYLWQQHHLHQHAQLSPRDVRANSAHGDTAGVLRHDSASGVVVSHDGHCPCTASVARAAAN